MLDGESSGGEKGVLTNYGTLNMASRVSKITAKTRKIILFGIIIIYISLLTASMSIV